MGATAALLGEEAGRSDPREQVVVAVGGADLHHLQVFQRAAGVARPQVRDLAGTGDLLAAVVRDQDAE